MLTDSLRLRPVVAACLLALAAASGAGAAFAQDRDARIAARAEFERGLAFVKTGEFEAAAEAFDLAYRTSPHYSVLYNLGLAYGTLGRPVEAVLTLERFLVDGGDRVPPARRREVKELIARQRSHVGELRLDIEPAGAMASIDGRAIGTAPIADPILLARGTHALVVTLSGFLPHTESLELTGGETMSRRVELRAEPTEVRPAVLLASCRVPAVVLSIDGETRGYSSIDEPFLVEPGVHTLRFTRAGYDASEQSISLAAGASARVDCRLVPDGAFAASEGAQLDVQTEPGAVVYLDGEPYRGERIVHGPHTLRVECRGFHGWAGTLSLEPRAHRQLLIALKPTREHLARLESEQHRRHVLATGIGLASLALIGGAAALHVWNDARYDAWNSDRQAARRQLVAGGGGSNAVKAWDDLTVRATSLERTDNLALGLGLAGVVGLTTAGIVWFSGKR